MVGRRRGAPPPPGPRRVVTRFQSRVDRISALPDDLLLQVLTCLRCTRTAARTALLASRWRHVWPELREFSFHGLTPDAIHAALAPVVRTGTSLEAIDIHLSRGTGHRALDAGSVSNLLRAAAGCSPVKLALTIPVRLDFPVELPRLNSAKSIELDVRDVCFALAAPVFPKLETLSLSGCIVDLDALVPRCPRLRVLSVTRTPDEVDAITVHSATLQELVVKAFRSTATIDIVAPELKKLTVSTDTGVHNSLSVVAPMVEEVTWRCFYYSMYLGIGKVWRVGCIKVRTVEKTELTDDDNDGEGSHQPRRAHVLSLDILDTPYPSQRDFAEELEKIPVTTFSVLELKIATWGHHVLGPLLLNLLQICTAVQRLHMVLVDTRVVIDPCEKWCPCQENNRKWRIMGASDRLLVDLTEVKIEGLKGDDEEIHFLKLIFRCAPMLQTMTLKLSDEVTDDWYNVFLDTVREYPYVNSSVCIDD